MREKGFTLVELLAVITILSLLILVSGMAVTNLLKSSKGDIYGGQLALIKSAAENWSADNLELLPKAGECKYITLGDLKDEGLFESTVINPETNEEFSDDLKVKITGTLNKYNNTVLNYEVNPETIDGCSPMYMNPQGTYLMVNPSVDSAETTFLGGSINRSKVESITITHKKTVPNNAIASWDVSAAKDKSVMAWYTDIDNNNLYELYIGGEGGVKANQNSSNLFQYFENAKTIDVTYLDTSEVTKMSYMYAKCSNITTLDLSNFDTSNVTSMYAMFWKCENLTDLNLNNFNTSKVTNMGYMFNHCIGLKTLYINSFDTSSVTDMQAMFTNNSNLKKLDISNFNTSKVGNMFAMFMHCSSLTNLTLANFNTGNVVNMNQMFSNCTNLTSLDLSNFDTSKVTSMRFLFNECQNLKELNLNNFNTSQVTDMYAMFSTCNNLINLNLASFDTSKVTNTGHMFSNCSNLQSIDFRKAVFTGVTTSGSMFSACNNLTTVYVKDTSVQTFINNLKSGVAQIV